MRYAPPNQANRPRELPSIPRPAQLWQLWPHMKTIKSIGQNIPTSKSIGKSIRGWKTWISSFSAFGKSSFSQTQSQTKFDLHPLLLLSNSLLIAAQSEQGWQFFHALHYEQALTGTRYPTLPYLDLIFTTRTLPGTFLKISGFRVVTIHAVLV